MAGSDDNEEKEQKIAVFPIASNPPHFGNILELFHASYKYSKIYVAVYNKPVLMPTSMVIAELKRILNRFTDMFVVIETDYDFSNINTMPPEYKKLGIKYIITSSNKIYANFAGKSFPFIRRVPKARGYYDEYQQTAYARGIVLDQIKKTFNEK